MCVCVCVCVCVWLVKPFYRLLWKIIILFYTGYVFCWDGGKGSGTIHGFSYTMCLTQLWQLQAYTCVMFKQLSMENHDWIHFKNIVCGQLYQTQKNLWKLDEMYIYWPNSLALHPSPHVLLCGRVILVWKINDLWFNSGANIFWLR